MKIIRLSINQIVELWDSVRFSIISAVFPEVTPDGEVLQDFQCKFIKEEMQCWCIHNEEDQILGYIITAIETHFRKKVLLVYSEHLFHRLPSIEDYKEVVNSLELFAKANDCHRITGYSANPNAISIAEKFGWSSEYRVLTKGI